jgi:hypothetical protein
MAETVFRGPGMSLGALLDNRVEPTDGPGVEYQANSFPDIRYSPAANIGVGFARIPGHLNNPYTVLCDNIPSSTSATTLAAAQNATNGTAFTLTTVSPGGSGPGVPSLAATVPLIPFQKSASSLVQVLAIDFGFTTGTTTAASATIVVPDSTLFYVGQWIVVGGAGNAGNTLSLITQVKSITDATHIVVTTAPVGALANAPIGSGNAYYTQYQPNTTAGPSVAATAVNPYSFAGVVALLNPPECITRNVTVTGSLSATGGNVIISGYDIYGVLMTETIAAPASATTVAGKKAFKYITSATPQFTDAHNYSVGIGNIAGFHLRIDKWEYSNIFFNGSFATTSNGWTAAVAAASGDVRGTIDVSNASGFNSAFNGSRRLALMMSVPLWNLLNGTPSNTAPMYGAAQT